MKLEVKIEDGQFKYDYDISDCSKQGGTMPITAEGLCLFTALLGAVSKHRAHKTSKDLDEAIDELKIKRWIEANPEKCKEILKVKL